MNDNIIIEALQNEEYLQEECENNCYCKKINREYPIIERVCNYCFIRSKHDLIVDSYIYNIKIIKEETKLRIINIIKNIKPIGKYEYTDNVISMKDIDKLIEDIENGLF